MSNGSGRKAGRPAGPSPAVRRAVIDAAREELAEYGYAQFSMERIASRAGVHRSTLYKHWPNRQELVVSVAALAFDEHVSIEDTGSWEGDLRLLIGEMLTLLDDPASRALMNAMASPSEPELRHQAFEMMVARVDRQAEPVRRAQARGEVDPSFAPELVIELVGATLNNRHVLFGLPTEPEFIDWFVDVILRATAPRRR